MTARRPFDQHIAAQKIKMARGWPAADDLRDRLEGLIEAWLATASLFA
jgi:hypothetical protein